MKVNLDVQGADQERLLPEPRGRDQARRRPQGDGRLRGEERPAGHRLQADLLAARKTPVGVDLLTYRNAPDDGYFLLLASPGMEAPAGRRCSRSDVCFVLDTSGSMAEAAEEDGAGEEGAVVLPARTSTRATASRSSASAPRPSRSSTSWSAADKENVDKAQAFVADAQADRRHRDRRRAAEGAARLRQTSGKTQARPAVRRHLPDRRPADDRRDERGRDRRTREQGRRRQHAASSPSASAPTSTRTCSTASRARRKAFSQYVLPEEDIEVKLSSFYTKIKEPVLTNVQVAFTGGDIKTTQLYPTRCPTCSRARC